MKRALFLVSLAAAAVTFTSLRAANARSRRLRRGNIAGQCADHRRKSRWSAYTAADFT
jgi:hypothetical protein